MSRPEATLDVARLQSLSLARHDHLRIDLDVGGDVEPHDLVRGRLSGSLPLTASVKQAGPLGDLVGTSWAGVYAVTPRLSDTLHRLGLHGWGVLPIVLEDSRPSLHDLALLTVSGTSGPVYGSGGVSRPGLDPLGQYLDPHDWDGSDIFMPVNSRVILVTGTAADRMRAENFRDVLLEPAGLEPLPR